MELDNTGVWKGEEGVPFFFLLPSISLEGQPFLSWFSWDLETQGPWEFSSLTTTPK